VIESKLISWLKERQLEVAVENTRVRKAEHVYNLQCGVYQGLQECLDKLDELLNVDNEDNQ
jgi:hypothetical protein